MSLNIQNNVTMPQNQTAFKANPMDKAKKGYNIGTKLYKSRSEKVFSPSNMYPKQTKDDSTLSIILDGLANSRCLNFVKKILFW